jgi:hypothetical protein
MGDLTALNLFVNQSNAVGQFVMLMIGHELRRYTRVWRPVCLI